MIVTQNSTSDYISSSYNYNSSTRYYQVNQTNAIAINADANSSQAELYYSYAYSASTYLARRRTYASSSRLYSSTSYDIGRSNCANLIEVKGNIVAISWTTSTYGMLSIYRKSDITLYAQIVGNSSFAGIASQIAIISSQNYHKVFFNSFNSTSLDHGQISVTEIFVHPNHTNSFSHFITKTFHSGGSEYTSYGRYFHLDYSITSCRRTSSSISGCEQYEMYIGNMNQNYSRQFFDVLKICTDRQVYNSSSDTCYSVGDNQFSLGAQQESAYDWATYDDTIAKNRVAVESIWDFGCPDFRFGKNCETWTNYMNRVGQFSSPYYSFTDSFRNRCKQTFDRNYCSAVTDCSKCEYRNGWAFVSGNWFNGSLSGNNPNPFTVFDTWNNQGFYNQDESIWGASSVNACSGSIESLKPVVYTPINTLCYWKLECSTRISINIEWDLSNMEQISVRKTLNGVVTELSGSSIIYRRSLFAGRQLSTTVEYNVYDADSVEIVYRNRADVNIPSNTEGGGLSDGQIAGIVIGSIIGGLIALACMAWFIILILSIWCCQEHTEAICCLGLKECCDDKW